MDVVGHGGGGGLSLWLFSVKSVGKFQHFWKLFNILKSSKQSLQNQAFS